MFQAVQTHLPGLMSGKDVKRIPVHPTAEELKPDNGVCRPKKEYKMISVLYPQLLIQGGISPFAVDYYWSSTESGAKYAWHVYFSHGSVYDGLTKTNLYKVRCIRDL